MSGQQHHPHVPYLETPLQYRPSNTEARDVSAAIPFNLNDSPAPTATMPTLEEMQALAAAQAEPLTRANEMLQQQYQQMVDALATFDAQAQQLKDSA